MKRTPIIAALVLSTVSSAIAQQQRSTRAQNATSAETAVKQLDRERIHAQITADTIALRRIYADDFVGIGPTGVVRNKAEVIADFTSHALTYQSITTAEVRVRVYGNTAVETGRSTMVGQDRNKTVPRDNRFTRVWVMTAGRWQLVANHYSLMTSQEGARFGGLRPCLYTRVRPYVALQQTGRLLMERAPRALLFIALPLNSGIRQHGCICRAHNYF